MARIPAKAFGLGAIALALSLLSTSRATAEVVQPDGQKMPNEAIGDANYIANNNTQFGLLFVSLDSLFKYRGENIDWFKDATDQPGMFSPLCDFTGQMVLRGGGCILDFGWYNAVASGGAVPTDAEVYTLVPKESLVGIFFPLVGDPPQQTFNAADIRNNPNYKGGLIGFALRGGGSTCTQTKFSQTELNLMCSGCATPGHWVSALTWQSTARPDAFYLGFEDLPSSTTAFTAGGRFKNDGDFNDFLYFVTGVACDGGGDVCNTGKPGQCSIGRTACGGGSCRQVFQAAPEVCDNVDNDCNGVVDDGAPCPAGSVCSQGVCVPACGSGEFKCDGGLVCVKGLCVEAACENVTCSPGQICRGGKCTDACSGVTCPIGQECQLGRCRDLCAGVTCSGGTVCDRGICVSSCSCKPCSSGKTCQPDGRCVDTGCINKTCPGGQVCSAGNCVDPCTGVVCPGGAACVAGVCQEPDPGSVTPGGAGGTFGVGTGGLTAGGATGAGGAAGAGANAADRAKTEAAACGCRMASPRDVTTRLALAGLALALGLGFGLRRRRGGR